MDNLKFLANDLLQRIEFWTSQLEKDDSPSLKYYKGFDSGHISAYKSVLLVVERLMSMEQDKND